MTGYRLDMSMMFAVHDALRRDMAQVARIAAAADDSPGSRLRAAMGWQVFKRFLTVHHTTEDVAIWPVLQSHVADRLDQAAVVDELEAEHAAIDPLLAAIDAAAVAGAGEELAGLTDALSTILTRHLAHEEKDGLALIDAVLSEEEWKRFSEEHRERVGDQRTLYMPWLLDQASEQTRTTILGGFPEQLLTMYREQWGPDYAALDLWGTDSPHSA